MARIARVILDLGPFAVAAESYLLWLISFQGGKPRYLIAPEAQDLLRLLAIVVAALGYVLSIALLTQAPQRRILVVGACVNLAMVGWAFFIMS